MAVNLFNLVLLLGITIVSSNAFKISCAGECPKNRYYMSHKNDNKFQGKNYY